jgi:hypothetical protein
MRHLQLALSYSNKIGSDCDPKGRQNPTCEAPDSLSKEGSKEGIGEMIKLHFMKVPRESRNKRPHILYYLIRNRWVQLYSSAALSQLSVGLKFMWTHEYDQIKLNVTFKSYVREELEF